VEDTISILNSKKQKLAATIHRPSKPGKFPAVILLNGFRGTKDEEDRKQLSIELAKNNIVAIRFDASGFGQSEGDTEKDYRLSNYFNDTEAVYDYLKQLPYVDKNHIGLYGHSMGAMLVVLFAAKYPEIQASVSVSPPNMMRTKNRLENIWVGWEENGYLEKVVDGKTVKIPLEFLTDTDTYNTLKEVTKIKKPILFILGTKDVNVLPEETKALYEKANQPKKLFIVDGMSHFYRDFPDKMTIVFSEILKFYKKYL
jgi:dipeptidyl aminopeptidase/acylaminoacyl peptidase